MTQNKYYVYLYLREDGTPYYVGKGQGRRAYSSEHTVSRPSKERIIFHTKNLTEDEAFELEKKLILEYGRKNNNTGILRNLTEGGAGASGTKWSAESVAKRTASRNTPETKIKISTALKKAFSRPEVKIKMSVSQAKAWASMDSKNKVKRSSGLNSPESLDKRLKKSKSPEKKYKLSEAQKAVWSNPELKDMLLASMNTPESKLNRSIAQKKSWARKKAEKLEESANLTEFFISDPIDR